MKSWMILAAALTAAPSAALACSCLSTDDPAQLRQLAADAAKDALALVEAEAETTYQQTPDGERMRVLRVIAGQAPERFRVERGHFPSSASCDVLYERGQRKVVLLYPSRSADGPGAVYRTAGSCTDHLLDKPAFRETLERLIGTGGGERGR